MNPACVGRGEGGKGGGEEGKRAGKGEKRREIVNSIFP